MACKKHDIEELQSIRCMWPDIPLDVVNEKHRSTFKSRKEAVDMYIDGYKMSEIEQRTGISHSLIPRLLNRCLVINSNGDYIGYQALLFYNHVSESHNTGSFQRLLADNPELKEYIEGCWIGDKKFTLEKNMNLTTLHSLFVDKCRKLGIPDYEYPFNTQKMAYGSLCGYIKEFNRQNLLKAAKRENKDNMQKLMTTGIGDRYTADPIAPYSAIQMDGHIIDVMYNVQIMNDDGTVRKKAATRMWVVAVMDVASRCVLGYSVTQAFNYDQYDVIEAFQNAIRPHKNPEPVIEGLEYPENGGYPSTAYPELEYAMFDTIMLDNAKSHLAKNTMEKMVEHLHCSVDFGSVATPVARGLVERMFGTIERSGFHRLPSTTGSSSKDLKRRDPEQAAIAYDITVEQLEHFLDVSFAVYNNTSHSSLNGQTPLECLSRRIFENGMCPTIADEEMRDVIERLNYITEKRIVRGGKNGKRAYIHYAGVDYRCNELAINGEYFGKEITLVINPRDISTIEAYTDKGVFIGTLKARGEYGLVPHSLKARREILSYARERGRDKLEYDMPITAYEKYLNERGKISRRHATKLDAMRRDAGELKPSELKEEKAINPTPVIPIEENIDPELYNCTDVEDFYRKAFT